MGVELALAPQSRAAAIITEAESVLLADIRKESRKRLPAADYRNFGQRGGENEMLPGQMSIWLERGFSNINQLDINVSKISKTKKSDNIGNSQVNRGPLCDISYL